MGFVTWGRVTDCISTQLYFECTAVLPHKDCSLYYCTASQKDCTASQKTVLPHKDCSLYCCTASQKDCTASQNCTSYSLWGILPKGAWRRPLAPFGRMSHKTARSTIFFLFYCVETFLMGLLVPPWSTPPSRGCGCDHKADYTIAVKFTVMPLLSAVGRVEANHSVSRFFSSYIVSTCSPYQRFSGLLFGFSNLNLGGLLRPPTDIIKMKKTECYQNHIILSVTVLNM